MNCSEGSPLEDLQSAKIKKSKKNVQSMIAAFNNFRNFFRMDVDELYCISSGSLVGYNVANDVLNADSFGKNVYVLCCGKVY